MGIFLLIFFVIHIFFTLFYNQCILIYIFILPICFYTNQKNELILFEIVFIFFYYFLQLLKDQTIKLQDQIAAEQLARESVDERKEKEIKLLENKTLIEINKEKQFRKENDNYLVKQIEEKVYNMRVDLSKEKKGREEDDERLGNQLNLQYNALKDEIENEKRKRQFKFLFFILMINVNYGFY